MNHRIIIPLGISILAASIGAVIYWERLETPEQPRIVPPSETVTNEELPPAPGVAGQATLAGIDSDGDGVRDDVQRWIALNILDSVRHREALRSVARASQLAITAKTKEQSIEAANVGVRSIECLSYLGVRKLGLWKEVQALMLNTEARIIAMDAHSRRIHGEVFATLSDSNRRTACTFDVEALHN